MKEVTLKIPDNRYQFFMELVTSLGFVKIRKAGEGDSDEEIIENLTRGFSEMQEIRKGRLKTTPSKDFLDELQA
jgi:hypothetical protein